MRQEMVQIVVLCLEVSVFCSVFCRMRDLKTLAAKETKKMMKIQQV